MKKSDILVLGGVCLGIVLGSVVFRGCSCSVNKQEPVQEQVVEIVEVDNEIECPVVDVQETIVVYQNSDYDQTIFDLVNGVGEISEDEAREIYEALEDGSFWNDTIFSDNGACGKDVFNYYLGYDDGLEVRVFYDSITDTYGVEYTISMEGELG